MIALVFEVSGILFRSTILICLITLLFYCVTLFFKIKIKFNYKSWILPVLFIIYSLTVLTLTLFSREASMGNADLHLFSSYLRAWHQIDSGGWQMLVYNVIMFIPFGLFLPLLNKIFKNGIIALCCSILASIVIEVTQFISNTGVFEIDDIFNNAVGALIGWGIVMAVLSLRDKKTNRQFIGFCYLIPPVTAVCLTISVSAAYHLKPYGNFENGPTYAWNMQNTEYSVNVDLNDEQQVVSTYGLVDYDVQAMKDYAKTILDYFNLNFTLTIEEEKYLQYENQAQSLVVYTDGSFNLMLSSSYTIDEVHLNALIEQYDLLKLYDYKYTLEQDKAVFMIPFSIVDEDAYSGEVTIAIDQQGDLAYVDYQVYHSKFVTTETIISEVEAFNIIKSGWFKAYRVDAIDKVEVLDCNLVYQRDSKDFYQPVYQFNVLINDQVYSELLIPAIK